MGALSKLLAKVAIRAINNATSNEELYDAAERVVMWSSQGLISDEHLTAVEESMIETIDGGDGE